MFYSFVGAKGGGKSYGLLVLLVDELKLTNRTIFTNLPVNIGKMQAWWDKNQGKVVDIAERIVFLQPDQLWEFWLFHKGGKITKRMQVPCAGGYHDVPDFSERGNDGGNLYIIDEAHIPFPSDRWAAVAKEANFYCTQERKLLDDTIFATQVPGQMAKPLRELMQEWTESRNLNKEPVFGCRFPGRFSWRMTLKCPTGVEQVAINKRIVKLDITLANCYDTMQGVGITGRGSAESERGARGLRWQLYLALVLAAIVGAGIAVFFGGKYAVKGAQKAIVGMVGMPESKSKTDGSITRMVTDATIGKPQMPTPQSSPNPIVTQGNIAAQLVERPAAKKLIGWKIRNGVGEALFDDGSVATTRDGSLTKASRHGVECNGLWYPMTEKLPSIPPPKEEPVARPVEELLPKKYQVAAWKD